jgi:NAD(P)-dependent dehydrogenase (short-subunit alcohol dehydrogenase family)
MSREQEARTPGGPLEAFRLDGRVAVVTGASSGLGSRFAETLASAGARVVAAARREGRLEELVGRLRGLGSEALAVRCDVTSDEDAERLVQAALDAYGGIDVLVNNAGIAPPEDAEIESPTSFRRVLETNTTGVFLCARAAGRTMLERGRGSIVNIASISGLVAGDGADTPSYTASKGAVVNLTRELGVRWAARGVRVNAIAPGYFPSEMTARELETEESRRFIAERTPLGRPGRVDELDGALLFLASDASSYVTGHTLVVDGGWTAR